MTDQPNAPAPEPQPASPPPAQPPAASPPAPAAPPPASAAPPAPAAPAAPSAMSSLLAGVSQGEMLMLGGALLYLIGDLVFGLFTGYYIFSTVGWLVAVVVAIMILVHARPMGGLSVPEGGYRFGLIVLGLVVLLAGIRYLLSDLMYIPGRSLNVMYFLGAIVFYVAVLLMAAGAYMIWRRQA